MREGCELPFASDELVSHDMLLRLSVVEDSGGRSWSLESRDDGVIRQRSNECFVDSIDACGGWLSLADIVDGVADGFFVGEDELFGECFALEYEYELVSLHVVFAAEEQKMVCAFCGVGAVRAVWRRRSFDSEKMTI